MVLKYFFGYGWVGGWWWVGVGGKIIPRKRQTSAKVLVEVETELGNIIYYPFCPAVLYPGYYPGR